ncbi:MAG TPA: futalosine hydrolase [Bacteroidales bacterium]|nr:futalosine hydrolase [Bacteroidales bacterium]HOU95893.1 futalosine hydrolase [Bacteroidales bacterium]HQG35878.1 futalosine hydrolase [Bacteroidales bacterium]HQG52388.1 futalosine hydrolase [Bacteroidales bacterium]HQJ20113.1 futalosine hydrolase [Bacteroidales bacterium]
MKILIVFATNEESDILKKPGFTDSDKIIYGPHEISVLVTGVSSVQTVWHVKHYFSMSNKPDLAINVGIAGSFTDEIPVGDVVMPVSDSFADIGIETREGFIPLKDMGIRDEECPFITDRIYCINKYTRKIAHKLRTVRAITVNTVTGTDERAEKLRFLFNPDIETMEGAAFFYTCIMENIPYIALRAVSNFVGERRSESWNMPLALKRVRNKLNEILLLIK